MEPAGGVYRTGSVFCGPSFLVMVVGSTDTQAANNPTKIMDKPLKAIEWRVSTVDFILCILEISPFDPVFGAFGQRL